MTTMAKKLRRMLQGASDMLDMSRWVSLPPSRTRQYLASTTVTSAFQRDAANMAQDARAALELVKARRRFGVENPPADL